MRGSVKALHFKLNGTKKDNPQKGWKEVVEQDMTARGLQGMDAQDHMWRRLGYKNWLTSVCGEDLPAPRTKHKTYPHSRAKR